MMNARLGASSFLEIFFYLYFCLNNPHLLCNLLQLLKATHLLADGDFLTGLRHSERFQG